MAQNNIYKVRSGFFIIALITGVLAISNPFMAIISGASLIGLSITFINKDY